MNRTLVTLLLATSLVAMAKDPQAPAKPAAPAAAPAKATPAAPAKAAPAAAIVGNKESKTFHKADCKTAAKMKDANKAEFTSAAEATKAGYKACKVCKP